MRKDTVAYSWRRCPFGFDQGRLRQLFPGHCSKGSLLLDGVLRVGLQVGRVAQKLHEPAPGRISGSLLEELGSGFHYSNLLRNRRSNPLVQRHPVLFSQPFGGLLDGDGKLQRVSSSTHRFTFFSSSAGDTIGIPNRAPAEEKSAIL
jgi:hypothetical protein